MTFRAMFAAAAVCIAAPMAAAQASPEVTIARFIKLANAGELTTAAGQAILTGEAKQFATDARSALPGADKVIVVNPALAVARIVLRGGAGQEADAYFYLEKTTVGWAVSSYRAMALSEGPVLELDTHALNTQPQALREEPEQPAAPDIAAALALPLPLASSLPESIPSDLQVHLDRIERDILVRTLRETRFNRTSAAQRLGISLRQIRYRMARLQIDVPNASDEPSDA